MKLIKELTEELQYISEAKESGEKSYFIEGVFLQAGIKNRNGRVYPSHIMEKAVDDYNRKYIKENRALGELGHPQGPTINHERTSHLIKSLVREGNNYIGRAKIITANPYGAIVKNLMDEGVKLGVSSRGMGTVRANNGIMEVQEDFWIATAADIVADPSAPDAFVSGILEGKEWVWNNGILQECAIADLHREIKTAPARRLNEQAVQSFSKFLSAL
jgi:hypothetical protein